MGEDPELLAACDQLPESLRDEWIDLLYRDNDVFSLHHLNRLIDLLDNRNIILPHKEKSRESLIRLKAVAEIFGQLEEKNQRGPQGSIEWPRSVVVRIFPNVFLRL